MTQNQFNQNSQVLMKKVFQIILQFLAYSFGIFFLIGFFVYLSTGFISFLFLIASLLSLPLIHAQINKVTKRQISGFAYIPLIFIAIFVTAINSPKSDKNIVNSTNVNQSTTQSVQSFVEKNSIYSESVSSSNKSEIQNNTESTKVQSQEILSSLASFFTSPKNEILQETENSQKNIPKTELPNSEQTTILNPKNTRVPEVKRTYNQINSSFAFQSTKNQANFDIIKAPKFANCTEAKNAGYGGMTRGTPAYDNNSGLDRDKDGIACDK